jgi:hypothetical protein
MLAQGFEDPRLLKLDASPYRQKLYFKNKNKNGILQIRSPSVNVAAVTN